MNAKMLKVLGIVVSLGAAGLSVAADMIGDKKLDDKVAEKVAEALKNQGKGS